MQIQKKFNGGRYFAKEFWDSKPTAFPSSGKTQI